MRILIVCKSLPHAFKGGIQTHVWELSGELVARGCEVTILTAGSWRNGKEVISMAGRRIVYLPYPPGRRVPLLRKTLEDVSFNIAAFGWLREHSGDYDRIHLQGRSGCFYAAVMPKDSTPVVTTFHRLLNVEYEYDGQQTNWLDGWLHLRIMHGAERAAARNTHHAIAVSEEMKRELNEYVGAPLAPISILPNGVHASFGDYVTEPDPWRLVFVGRLERIKGVFTLLESMPKMDERVQLTLVGDGPERKALEQLSRKLGLRLRVQFLGDQDSESVRYWIQRSYALVLPSFHESQGIVLLEAGICGRPVIAASAPGINEVIIHGENGLMFPAGDATSLSVVTNHLFRNPKLAERLGQTGRARAETLYDWRRIADQTVEVYANVGCAGVGERWLQRSPANSPGTASAAVPTPATSGVSSSPAIAVRA